MNHYKIPFMVRVSRVLLSESSSVTLLLGIAGILLGLGFLLGDPANPNYQAITAFGSAEVWSIAFIFYGIVKLAQTLGRCNIWLKLLMSLSGLWAWNYVFLSFTIFDLTPVAPTEILLALPIVCEVWGLAVELFAVRIFKGRRLSDK
jgi:hypothetical protein